MHKNDLNKFYCKKMSDVLIVHRVPALLWAAVQPTLDPSMETIYRSNALAQERGELVGVCECVRDVQSEEG